MSVPSLHSRLLQATAGAAHSVEFTWRRADETGALFPTDRPGGQTSGRSPQRIAVLGERGETNLGVLTNELGIAGFLAREHRRTTGRGCDWSLSAFPSDRLADGPAVLADRAAELVDTDLVVLLIGVTDARRLLPVVVWERQLRRTLDLLVALLPEHALVAVAEVPPLGHVGSLSRPARVAAGRRSSLLNRRTRRVVGGYPTVTAVEYPRELADDLGRPTGQRRRHTHFYAAWARVLMAALVDVPGASDLAPAAGEPAAYRSVS
ncbi:hypothetical protein [Frigoribacterium sp. PhB24]|uniref:hypothetical protein n=1 Tax=Frigoribacterium sp. PhB24 TaxID=2485204 RepID=UPI000F482088|nr:hypothetical protein [Frigoribacterium sp. PhB24]ROS57787.1 hypothetical protein EDF50_0078 [Frigoribacterium sp. PhB24]